MASEKKQLFLIDGIKAFAILGILLNHFVESFGSFPLFSNPSYDWPDLSTRIATILPSEGPLSWKIVQFLGWLGDMGPGIFIFVSGFTLTFSSISKNSGALNLKEFYLKRFVRIYPLFLVIHLIVLLSGFLFQHDPILQSPKLFLSLLGLRFTEGLFFLPESFMVVYLAHNTTISSFPFSLWIFK